jgi:hypothetical protein
MSQQKPDQAEPSSTEAGQQTTTSEPKKAMQDTEIRIVPCETSDAEKIVCAISLLNTTFYDARINSSV